MNNCVMYFHAGAANHGCEAIVRATNKILQSNMVLFSSNVEEDIFYQLNDIVNIKRDCEKRLKRYSVKNLLAAIAHKISHNDYIYTCLSHNDFFKQISRGDICLSIGGDNYCYNGRDVLGYYNKYLHKMGVKTVLWGCSFEPEDMTEDIAKDIALYDLIVARESISYEVLAKENTNTVLLPDPAFQLDTEELDMPKGFIENHTIGINVSPLINEYGNGDIIKENFRELLKYIINNTQENIAFIPHVVKAGNDDRTILDELYKEFGENKRVIMIEDCNCMQLKGYISRCSMFIGARTHATIAAYSSCVPTLVVGYSVKAKGIAKDLFGTYENYVVPVQSLNHNSDLLEKFKWLQMNEESIRRHLKNIMPEYKSRVLYAKELVEKL